MKTIIKLTLEYKGIEYHVKDLIDGYVEKEVAIFLYDDGNFADDSYRRELINKQYGKDTIQELPLGSDEIDLIRIEIEYI